MSWECVLNKRDAFRKAFDGFDLEKICAYHEDKLEMLRAQMNDHADIATEHIGLANVARRYYLTFHDMQRVTIDSTVDEGTVVRLIYPRRID